MNISKRAKLMVAAAGIVAAAGTTGAAFTATGLADSAPAAQFIGGTVTQNVTGATLTDISYNYSDSPADTTISSVTLTFDPGADGEDASITLATASDPNPDPTTDSISCGTIGTPTDNEATCTVPDGQAGVTGVNVTVAAPTS